MTGDAIAKFRNSNGWAVGGDASVAIVKVGANGSIDTSTVSKPVQVFMLTNSGLIGDLSLGGTKITKLDRMLSTKDAPQREVAERVMCSSGVGQRKWAGIFQGSSAS
jgi:lipid-binding SYLF domain-containing protein